MTRIMKSPQRKSVSKPALPPLENGDCMDQKTFHARYEAMPEDVRAELIGGIVYMASPQKLPHGRTNKNVGRLLDAYEDATEGTESLAGITDILGPDSEPEPDDCLRILPEYGGQSSEDDDGYLIGAPELIVETASTTESRDLHQKRADYEKSGVREYVVVALRSKVVVWFVLEDGKFEERQPDADGLYRSRVFPGLWIDPEALLRGDRKRLLAVLKQGLASKEHAAFAAKLVSRKKKARGS